MTIDFLMAQAIAERIISRAGEYPPNIVAAAYSFTRPGNKKYWTADYVAPTRWKTKSVSWKTIKEWLPEDPKEWTALLDAGSLPEICTDADKNP